MPDPVLPISVAVARLARSPRSSGLFTDYDGTLAPIVGDPEAAVPLPGTLEALGALSQELALVAVVSGRPAGWLGSRLAPKGQADPLAAVELFGLHGIERLVAGTVEPRAEARPYAAVVADLVAEARAAGVPGLAVEDKAYGLTLHWRTAADPERAAVAALVLAHELAGRSGLLERPGKASIELVPPIGIDKGTVVRERGGGLEAVAFLGDDAGDLLAFDALDGLEAAGAYALRIAVTSAEAPPELLARADLVLGGPSECVPFLEQLARAAGGG